MAPRKSIAENGRDQLRSKLLSTHERRSALITIWDTEIELRQPLLGEVFNASDEDDDNSALINALIRYSFVPGTDERVFEEGDRGAMMSWPMGDWVSIVNDALTNLAGLDVEEAEGN